MPVAGRDERPRSSASGWAWVELGDRGWLKPPTPEESCLDMIHSRGSILARLFKDWKKAAGRDASVSVGRKAGLLPLRRGRMGYWRVRGDG